MFDFLGFWPLPQVARRVGPDNSTACMDFGSRIGNLVWILALAPRVPDPVQRPRVAIKLLKQRFEEMMNFWVPLAFGTFKLGVLGVCMFLAIKSHREGARKEKEKKEMERLESLKALSQER
ncbi:hypothetical protein [Achromobacter animicus]|uniref:hypothetical protein n=1 Tax=Achromobacter animicus TaxID=1389935 RepID=UPI00158291BE|nr:hypothetical protein [Achromobacter animicus]